MIVDRVYHETHTESTATLPDSFQFKFIERPWLDNKPNISCIPAGQYKFKRDHTGRHQWWKILDVEGRTFIEIHEGYEVDHSLGCLITDKKNLEKMQEFYDDDTVEYIIDIREG